MAFNAGEISATATIDTEPFQLALVRMDKEGRKFASKDYKATVGADTAEADRKIDDTDAKLRGIGSRTTSAKVTADTTEALLEIRPLTEKLEDIRDRVSTAKVGANTAEAKRKLEDIDLTARRIGLISVRPNVSTLGLERANIQADSLLLKLGAINRSGGGGGRGGVVGALSGAASHAPSLLSLGLAAGSTTIAPLAGVALGAGASLLTPFTAAGIGIASFGAAAHSSIAKVQNDTKTLTSLMGKYNAATTDKTRAAAQAAELKFWRSLSPAEQKAVGNLHSLSKEWTSFQKSLQPEIFPLISGGVGLLRVGLKDLQPVAKATGLALDGIEKAAGNALSSPFFHDFLANFLPGEATKAVNSFATALGNLLTGGAHLVEDFAPLGHDFEGGLDRLTKKFEDWTEGKGPSKFVNWVRANSPAIKHDVEELASGIVSIAKALTPVGEDVLHTVGAVAHVIGELGDDHPKVLKDLAIGLLAVGGGLKVIAGGEKAITILSALSRLTPGGGGFGRLGFGAKTAASGIGTAEAVEGGGVAAGAGTAAFGGLTAASLGAVLAPIVAGGVAIAILDSKQSSAPGAGAIRSAQEQGPQPFAVGRGGGVTGVAGLPKISVPDMLKADYAVEKLQGNLNGLGQTLNQKVRGAISGFNSGLGILGRTVDQVGSKKITGLTLAAQANRIELGNQVEALSKLRAHLTSLDEPIDVVNHKVDAQALSLIHSAEQLYNNKAAVDRYLKSLGLVPSKIETQFIADTAKAKAEMLALQRIKNNLAATAVIQFQDVVNGFIPSNPKHPRLPGGQDPSPPSNNPPTKPPKHGGSSPGGPRFRQATPPPPHTFGRGSSKAPLPGFLQGTASPNSSSGSSSGSGSSSTNSGGPSGPSHAAVSNGIAALINYAGLTFLSDLRGTVKQIDSGIKQMIDRLNDAVRKNYLSGDARLVHALRTSRGDLTALARREGIVSNQLGSAQNRLSSLQSQSGSLRSGTVSAFQGLGDVSQLSNVTSVKGILSVIGKQDTVARAFSRNLATLRKKGLSKEEYEELQQAGPAAAGQVVALLATATDAQIRSLNKDTNLLTDLGISTGKAGSSFVFGGRIAAAKSDVKRLTAESHELVQLQTRTARALETVVKDGIKSPGTEKGLAVLHQDNIAIRQALRALAGAPKQARTNQRTKVSR